MYTCMYKVLRCLDVCVYAIHTRIFASYHTALFKFLKKLGHLPGI